MRVTIVIPTYATDAELVAQAARGVARLRRLCPDDRVRLVIADDAAAPLPDLPRGTDARLTTTFPRNGNLNGMACIRGLLETYAAAALPDDDWVVKLDSDTYLCHFEWLRGRTPGHAFCNNAVAYRIFGSCYALSPDAARDARALTDREDIAARLLRGYGPEDLCISALCRLSGHPWHMLSCREGGVFFEGNAPAGCSGRINIVGASDEALRHPFVSCKDFWVPDAEANARRLQSGLAAMTGLADFADDRPIPEDALGRHKPPASTISKTTSPKKEAAE